MGMLNTPPPHGGQHHNQLHSRGVVHSHGKKNADGNQEGDGAPADVPHRVSPGGHLIHAFARGHVGEERIVEQAGARKTDIRKHITDQEHLPVVEDCHDQRTEYTDQHEEGEKFLFHPLVISQRAENRGQDRHNKRCQ